MLFTDETFLRSCHIRRMAEAAFKIIAQSDHTFEVRMTTADGRLKTITGFASEHEAAAWVEQTKRALHDPRVRYPTKYDGHC